MERNTKMLGAKFLDRIKIMKAISSQNKHSRKYLIKSTNRTFIAWCMPMSTSDRDYSHNFICHSAGS